MSTFSSFTPPGSLSKSQGRGRMRSNSDASASWTDLREASRIMEGEKQYVILAADAFKSLGQRMQEYGGADRFRYYDVSWDKFPDGTDNITVGGFTPHNYIQGANIIFLASFHNNDVTLSQFSVLIVLLQSFIESLTIVLPFYPVGTNERVDMEGKVATANTYSMLLSSLPSIGRPIRIMIYDIHTLQNRFYFHNNCLPSLHTATVLLFDRLKSTKISVVAFPDDGAAKRFGKVFMNAGFEIIICGKVRDGDKRHVRINEGDPRGKEIVIVDDLVQTGGTLAECGQVLRDNGAKDVTAYVTHGVFPNQAWKRFTKKHEGDRAVFSKIWLTNSIPSIVNDELPSDDVFEVLDLLPLILHDLHIGS